MDHTSNVSKLNSYPNKLLGSIVQHFTTRDSPKE